MFRLYLMYLQILLLALLWNVGGSKGDHCVAPMTDQARYDHYRMYYVELESRQHVQIFQELEEKSDSCTFYGHAREPNQKLTIMVAAHKVADFADLLAAYNVKHRILTYNFQEKIDQSLNEALPKGIDVRKFDWEHYFHLETIDAWMEDLAKQYSNELTLLNIGDSAQGLPIKGLKLACNQTSKTIFIESGIHAREWIAPATATYIMNELLTSNDSTVQRLANTYNWIILPVVNPDGYKFSFEGDRMWRKNRVLFGICRGVDLNRNYPFHWNTTGASGDPCRYDYSGPSAGSEVETQRVMKYVEDNVVRQKIRTYVSLHSFSQMIMFPYGHTAERVSNYDDLTAIGKKASEKIRELSGRVYTSGSIYETIYPSSGGSKDWAHGKLGIPITFTFELRPPHDGHDLFMLPAVEIQPTAEEAFAAILTIVEEAEARGYYK